MSVHVRIDFTCDALVKPELVAQHRTDVNGTPRCHVHYVWGPLDPGKNPLVNGRASAVLQGWTFRGSAAFCPDHEGAKA